jgi:23S rRNA pseudouridine1911/1915/1917 synthase
VLLLGEDAARLFLWKPAGLPVFPPHADPAGDCLLARLLAAAPERAEGWPAGFEGGIAHRLDTATSGLVVAARTPAHLAPLRAQFTAQTLRKRYLFVSSGAAEAREATVTVEIAHHPNRRDRMVARRGPRTAHRGKWYPAWSHFQPLEASGTTRAWACTIRTGVMHQIRVHAASIGVPLDGDPLYGGAPGAYLLHAHRIEGPGWSSPDAPLPEDAPDVLVRSLRRR